MFALCKIMSAHVYAVIDHTGRRCYVGSTTETIHSRLIRHRWRAHTNERPHSKLHGYMRAFGPQNFTVELIESVPLEERVSVEGQYVRSHGLLNYQVPGRTRAEYRREVREAREVREVLAMLQVADD